MHGACAVKMWKRLVVCIGICGYLVVVMVARSTMEDTSSPYPTLESTTGRYHQVAPQEESTLWIRQGTPPVLANRQTSSIGVTTTGKLMKSSSDGSIHKMTLISAYLWKKVNRVGEPDGFVSRNNSLRPLFAELIHSENEETSPKVEQQKSHVTQNVYRNLILVKHHYMTENMLSKANVGSLNTNAVRMRKRKRFVDSIALLYRSRLPLLSSYHQTVTLSPEKELCNASFKHRRMRSMCMANPKATECHAQPLVCNPHLCQVSEEEDADYPPPFLLVVIHSHPTHGHRRDAIRDTWGSIVRNYQGNLHSRVVFLFVLGSSKSLDESRAVTREVSLYRDIIQYELHDTYDNLTVKSVLALDWIHAFCSNVTYVLKTDDDAFMNIANIVKYLRTSAALKGVLLGSLHPKSAVQRTGQWRVGKEIYQDDIYPPYCSGTAYVMTSDIAHALYSAHYDAIYRDAVLLPMEDVYVTGLLPSRLRMSCNHSEPFPNWTTGPSPRSVGQYLRGEVFGVHGISPSGMYGMYKLVTQCTTCRTNATTLRKWFALLTGAT